MIGRGNEVGSFRGAEERRRSSVKEFPGDVALRDFVKGLNNPTIYEIGLLKMARKDINFIEAFNVNDMYLEAASWIIKNANRLPFPEKPIDIVAPVLCEAAANCIISKSKFGENIDASIVDRAQEFIRNSPEAQQLQEDRNKASRPRRKSSVISDLVSSVGSSPLEWARKSLRSRASSKEGGMGE